MKKTLSLMLSLALMMMSCTTALASNYAELVSSILDDMSTNNAKCSGAPQQSANGAYRLTEMLAVIALANQ